MDGGLIRGPRSWRTAIALLAAALALPAFGELPFFHHKGPYRKGQVVTIRGQVVGAHGRPLAGVSVLFEASRNAFRLKKLRREVSDTLQVPAVADDGGRFSFDWRWDPYYNVFALAVALPVRQGERETHEVFYRLEITAQVGRANPLDVGLVLPDTSAIEELRAFLESVSSDDEKRVYREMGRPDRVDTGETDYDPDRSWWYFEAGEVYRFRDGRLDKVVRFDPVPAEVEE